MNITLINPPFTFIRKSDIVFSQCLGILYIGAYLKEKGGHMVTIIDALFSGKDNVVPLENGSLKIGLSDKEIIARIPNDTNLIGLSVPFSHLAFLSHNLLNEIKRTFPSIPLVMGGVYPSTQPNLAIQSAADYIVLGEGEISLCQLAEHLIDPERNALPSNIISKTVPQSLDTAVPTYIEDINGLPLPARNLVPFKEYVIKSQRNRLSFRSASIITSRGCPFSCEFCSVHPVCGYKWRPGSPNHVLQEIDELIENYGVNNIEIEDDNFTLNRDRAVEILDGVIERNSRKRHNKLFWSALNGLRIDTLDTKLIDMFKSSNCLGINIALEHGDREVLKSMNKKMKLSKVVEVVEQVNKFKIPATVFVIYGYPGETRERFENALNFYCHLKKIAPSIEFAFFIAQPYPGTKLFERCVKEGYIESDFSCDINKIPRFSTESSYLIKTPDFDEEELKRRRKVLMATLSPRSYLRNKLKDILPERFIPYGRLLYHRWKRFLGVK